VHACRPSLLRPVMPIPTAIEAVATPVPARLGMLAATVQPCIDAVAPAVETMRAMVMAMRFGARRTPVQAVVDAIAAAVELVFAMFADAVETVVDAIAVVASRGGTRAQQQRDGDQDKGGLAGHRPAPRRRTSCVTGNASAAGGLTRLAAGSGMVMMGRDDVGESKMADGFVALYIFMLAAIAGHVIISRVPVILHTPLMSGSNFIHGIVLIGAMVVLGHADTTLEKVIGFAAVLLGAGNAAGGYVVTERMLEMFKSSKKPDGAK
jgi:H+-translocating NAD(P) transhydrogenase subunit alpha